MVGVRSDSSLHAGGTARFEFVSLDGDGCLRFFGMDHASNQHQAQRDHVAELGRPTDRQLNALPLRKCRLSGEQYASTAHVECFPPTDLRYFLLSEHLITDRSLDRQPIRGAPIVGFMGHCAVSWPIQRCLSIVQEYFRYLNRNEKRSAPRSSPYTITPLSEAEKSARIGSRNEVWRISTTGNSAPVILRRRASKGRPIKVLPRPNSK